MINGEILKQAVISGAHNISVQKNHINDLNIFPVPDGDTGTNMSMTIMAAAKALEDYDGTNAGEVAEMTASSMLRGARGNSGVITSILFRGFAQGLKGMEEVNGKYCRGSRNRRRGCLQGGNEAHRGNYPHRSAHGV